MSFARTLYFGYGSNLWLQQMKMRCPDSIYRGIARLDNWRWIINERGYANVVPSSGDLVYGFVYELSASDEERLDKNEGVPYAYVKRTMGVQMVEPSKPISRPVDGQEIQGLVYVDEQRVKEDVPKEEYIHRMNMGIKDALEKGMEEWYVKKYIRPFIPESVEVEGEITQLALEQARHFNDEPEL